MIVENWDAIKDQIGGTAKPIEYGGRTVIRDVLSAGDLKNPEVRKKAFAWLAERLNTFVNVLRPRVRAAVADQAN